ncbi:hypothetical protein CONLIGDRAFT_108308 [Coniochaeta ligniaria NRRL 30616]|uniref:Uncharacterized protein n=1 Tax=Coniochaeta ligniaria NRRL 30616 TaxID=1408157 RepID=A0A1J7J352_9PEZI|nr:hypothetical protein CONLIGDRAFT_108308 [Coniochaeta ligniaria NRRL 30616]
MVDPTRKHQGAILDTCHQRQGNMAMVANQNGKLRAVIEDLTTPWSSMRQAGAMPYHPPQPYPDWRVPDEWSNRTLSSTASSGSSFEYSLDDSLLQSAPRSTTSSSWRSGSRLHTSQRSQSWNGHSAHCNCGNKGQNCDSDVCGDHSNVEMEERVRVA